MRLIRLAVEVGSTVQQNDTLVENSTRGEEQVAGVTCCHLK